MKEKNQNLFWGLFAAGALVFILFLAFFGPEPEGAVNTDAPSEVSVEVRDTDWIKGNPDAAVTLVEYADFQCPACAGYHDVVQQLTETYGDDMKFVYRHYPLTSIHANAFSAARASEAAGIQGKFWEMNDLLYTRQVQWNSASPVEELFETYASELGLDLEQYRSDYESAAVRSAVNEDLSEARALGFTGTPTFVLDGKVVRAPATVDGFASLIDQRITLAELLSQEDTTESTDASVE